jgi:hypothetical protein
MLSLEGKGKAHYRKESEERAANLWVKRGSDEIG